MNRTSGGKTTIKLWDAPTRLFHWTLAVLFFVSFYTGEEGPQDLHELSGLAILTLVLFRIVWGLFGSSSARFSNFLTGPKAVLGYIRSLLHRDPPHTAGHNPTGGWAIAALLLLLLAQAGTGLFANDDIFYEGPLAYMVNKDTSDALTGIHHELFEITIILVVIHIVTVIGYLALFKENLIRPMITGLKEVDGEAAANRLKFVKPVWALGALGLAAGFVWWLVQ